MTEIRCPSCGKMLGRLKGEGEYKCNKCKSLVLANTRTKEIRILEHQKKSAINTTGFSSRG